MKPRDRVLAALDHRVTDRVPVDLTHGQIFPELEDKLRLHYEVRDTEAVRIALGIDLRWVRPIYLRPEGPAPKAAGPLLNWFGATDGLLTYDDDLGVRPLAEVSSVAEVERFPWPSADCFDYSAIATLARTYQDYAIIAPAWWSPLFCRISELCGMERALMMLVQEPALVEAMVEHITDFYLEFYRRSLDAAPGQIDIAFTGDDLSGQQGLLFSRETFRRFFKRALAKIFEVIKGRGVRVMFHICGAVEELIPDLLEIGMDILNPLQFSAAGMDPQRLKAEYGRQLSFYGGIDIQRTLPYGTTEQVRAEARERIEVLGRGGGYILGPAHSLMDDVPVANVLAMYDEARRCKVMGG
jgi:uroporphyrinogen decarboxylase